jgi:hypothetical protein
VLPDLPSARHATTIAAGEIMQEIDLEPRRYRRLVVMDEFETRFTPSASAPRSRNKIQVRSPGAAEWARSRLEAGSGPGSKRNCIIFRIVRTMRRRASLPKIFFALNPGFACNQQKQCALLRNILSMEVVRMRKTLAILATVATVGATTMSAPAEARGWGWGPGIGIGFAVGALAAGAYGAYGPYGYYGPGYGYGYYGGPRYYGPGYYGYYGRPYYGPGYGPYAYYGGPYRYGWRRW